jgi:hypothetical protein
LHHLLNLGIPKHEETVAEAVSLALDPTERTQFAAALGVLAQMPDVAVAHFETLTDLYCDSAAEKHRDAAGCAIVAALRSSTWRVSSWMAWYRLMLESPSVLVQQAALCIIPEDTATFASLTCAQRLAWLDHRDSIETPARTEDEYRLLRFVLATNVPEEETLRCRAIFGLGRSVFGSNSADEKSFQTTLVGLIKTPNVSHAIRSHAIVALGLRGAKARAHLSDLYPIYEDNPFNLGGITGEAIARIVSDSPPLPQQVEFCSIDGEDGRVGVLGRLLESTIKGVRTAAARTLCAHPKGFAPLRRRLEHLAETVRNQDTSTFRAAALAVATGEPQKIA